MPSKFSWSKSNRSHSSADSSPGHPSPVPSVNIEAAAHQQLQQQQLQQQQAQAQVQQNLQQPQQQQQQQQPPPPVQQQHIPPGSGQQAAFRQQQFPQRTTSHRHSAHLSLDHSQNSLQFAPSSQHSPGIEQRRGSHQPQSSTSAHQDPPKKSLRSRIAAGLSGHSRDSDERSSSKNGLGRRVSIRKTDNPAEGYHSGPPSSDRLQAARWSNPRQGSSPHLPTSNEQDEDNLDPFLQHEDNESPAPPPKDVAYQQHQQQQQQQFAPNPQQQQQQQAYNQPPLARVDTEGSYRTQGGVDRYSPEQHQGAPTQQPTNPQQQQQQHQQQQQQQYQSYQPSLQPSQSSNEYQAFHPQPTPSPHLSTTQLQSPDHIQQQNYQPYQQQQPQQLQQAQQLQQQSPQDAQPPPPHYQQQQQFSSPAAQPHQGQDIANPLIQQGRPSLELQNPKPTHQVPQIVQHGQQVDPQHLQQLRPPSSHQLAPPSPLQQPSQYQPYDAQQQGHSSQSAETRSLNTTPPQQGQDSMPPAGAQQRNTLRKVNDVGGPPSGAPSREASLLQQAPPQASQGQPYRGEAGGKGQPGQGGDMGRATPPPGHRGSDMTEEEVNQLLKEHDILREKYQKVKRYFFEQQSQVHALQNTIANQRLSLSRTSWDDSEYSTRFNRLDGLIAQLSFAIRKDWKQIPSWLQTVVNKNALETGKQEMTAVGRAFITSWMVENIFEKYFHPDLEPTLSVQLKGIQHNIRRLSPPCHTTEDEDALVSKIVNWRLATLEGLADQLKSQQAQTYRHNLVEDLKEGLIDALQENLNEPAPPDLQGNVPMIIELAVNVAQHLPLESREVHIEYFRPGHSLVSEFMKMETGIPALTSPIKDFDDAASLRSVASKVDDAASIAEQEQQAASQPPKDVQDKKRGMFGFGASKKPPQAAPAQLGKREASLGQGESQQSLSQNPPGSSNGPRDESPPRVRMAVGVAVQIRGKSILIKAPVYST